jgi:16S rRNA (uracil1498-N3)-methyltransferase
LGKCLDGSNRARAIHILVGPEGGFDDAERAAAITGGFEPVSLGSFVLRTETAVTASLGAIVSRIV